MSSSNNNKVMPSLSAKTSSMATTSSTASSKKSKSKSTKKKSSSKSKITFKKGAGLRRGPPLAPLPPPLGVEVKQLTYTKQVPGLSTSLPLESNSSKTWNPPPKRYYQLVAPGKKNSKGKSVNRSNASSQQYESGVSGVAKKNAARLDHEGQFAQQLSIALDQLHGCKHGNVIENKPNSFYVSDLPALFACLTKANPKTGKLEPYDQLKFFRYLFGSSFRIVKDPRKFSNYSVKKGDVLIGYHPDPNAFLPGNAASIAKVVFDSGLSTTNNGAKLRGQGKGASAPDSDVYQLPSSCVNRNNLKNITNEDKENVISHMMTLDEDKLEEFLEERLTLLVKQRLLVHLGHSTMGKRSAECKAMIVDAIKKRKEDEGNLKPAAK